MDISQIYGEIEIEGAFKFLNLSFASTSNYWVASSHNEASNKVYEFDELKALKPDFETDLPIVIEIILNGLHVQKIN